ncbi:MAG: AMIN-like domain-containing (lipo)protein [Dermatophilaceae bacterium]
MTRRTRLRYALYAALLAVPVTVGATVSSASAAPAPFCGITWGSLDKHAGDLLQSSVTGVRTGRHDCFDRLVIDVDGPAPGYSVSYVDTVLMDPSGMPVPLRGGARLRVVVKAPAYTSAGVDTYSPANPAELSDVTGYRTLRQVAWAGTFEGQTTIGVGVRARLPFRVFTLPGPGAGSRVVIDVAHRW